MATIVRDLIKMLIDRNMEAPIFALTDKADLEKLNGKSLPNLTIGMLNSEHGEQFCILNDFSVPTSVVETVEKKEEIDEKL